MDITLEVPDRVIADTLCSGFEGGIAYWARIVRYTRDTPHDPIAKPWGEGEAPFTPKYISYPLTFGCGVRLEAPEYPEQECRLLNRTHIADGLRIMAAKYPKHFGDMLSEHGDATTGDVLIQCAVFGEVVFG